MPGRLPIFAEHAATPSRSPNILNATELSPCNCEPPPQPRLACCTPRRAQPAAVAAPTRPVTIQEAIHDATLNPRAESFAPTGGTAHPPSAALFRLGSAPPSTQTGTSALDANAAAYRTTLVSGLNIQAREFQPCQVATHQHLAILEQPHELSCGATVIPTPFELPSTLPSTLMSAEVVHLPLPLPAQSPAAAARNDGMAKLPPSPPPLSDEVLRAQLLRISRELERTRQHLAEETAEKQSSLLACHKSDGQLHSLQVQLEQAKRQLDVEYHAANKRFETSQRQIQSQQSLLDATQRQLEATQRQLRIESEQKRLALQSASTLELSLVRLKVQLHEERQRNAESARVAMGEIRHLEDALTKAEEKASLSHYPFCPHVTPQ